jgi:hypothetical protein
MFELPDGYIRNKLLSNDNSDGTDYWANNVNNTYQVPAYKWVQNNLIEKISEESTIIEIGCGMAARLIQFSLNLRILLSELIKQVESARQKKSSQSIKSSGVSQI